MRHRIVQQARCDQPCRVRHVHPEEGSHLVGNVAEGGVVEVAGIGACADGNHPGFLFSGQIAHLVHVDAPGQRAVLFDAVMGGFIQDARKVDRAAVREMPAVGKVQSEEGVSRLQECQKHGSVRAGAGMRLHVYPVAAEQFLRSLSRQILRRVHMLASAVIPFAGESFRVFVGQWAAQRLQHGPADEIFRRNQFKSFVLTIDLLLDGFVHPGVVFLKIVHGGAVSASWRR